jgi:hypothetical protein
MAWTSAHTLLGELENGVKLVYTQVVPDSAVATAVVISPLETVITFFGGIKDPGTVPTTAIFEQSATQSNSITITPAGDMSGGVIGILSMGL